MNRALRSILMVVRAQRDKTRERHSRESAAQAGRRLHISRELIRKARFVKRRLGARFDKEIAAGVSVDQLYRRLKGDESVQLNVRISAKTRQAL